MRTEATAPYKRVILTVALIIAVRVLGVSAILPVFSPYGQTLTDSTLLVGIALSAYGLTMAAMQVPMGSLSDRWGRRPVLVVGLLVFVLGNLAAGRAEALADVTGRPAIQILIAARLLEGLGAVSSVGTALITDVVPEERRTFGLAMAGIGAGTAFLVGVSVGPWLADLVGVPGLFLLTALVGALLIPVVYLTVPSPKRLEALAPPSASDADRLHRTSAVLQDPRLLRLDAAGLVMNLVLVSVMFALPLSTFAGTPARFDEPTYRRSLVVMVLVGGVLMLGLVRRLESRGRVRDTALLSAFLIGLGGMGLLTARPLWLYVVLGVAYFGGHAGLSATLPSLVGRIAAREHRGAAMGALNTWTYLGSFVGGPLAAVLFATGARLLAGVVFLLALVAAILLVRIQVPPTETTIADDGRATAPAD